MDRWWKGADAMTDHERQCYQVSWDAWEEVDAWLKAHPEYENKRPPDMVDKIFAELPEKIERLKKHMLE